MFFSRSVCMYAIQALSALTLMHSFASLASLSSSSAAAAIYPSHTYRTGLLLQYSTVYNIACLCFSIFTFIPILLIRNKR